MRQREEGGTRLARDERRLACGGVLGLARSGTLVGEERGLVDEHVGAARGLDDARRRRGVSREDDAPSPASGPEYVVRPDRATVRQGDALAALERAAGRTVGDAERVGGGDVEPPGPLVLTERVSERRASVLDREGNESVAVPLDRIARRQLPTRSWYVRRPITTPSAWSRVLVPRGP